MTEYKISCKDCTNKAISSDGSFYCLPFIQGRKTLYFEGETEETKEDPDIINCDQFTKEARNLAIYEVEAEE